MAYLVKIAGTTNGEGWYLPEWTNFLEHIDTFHAGMIALRLDEYNGYLIPSRNGMVSKEEVGFDSEQDYIHFKLRFG